MRTAQNTTSDKGVPQTEAMRSCVVCRESKPQSSLLRLALVQGEIVAAAHGGRGAYVCVARQCLQKLPGALARALGEAVPPLDNSALLASLEEVARRRLLEKVGLARRTGVLTHGVERLANTGGSLVLVATDLSERSSRVFEARQPAVADGAELGHAAGMGWVGAVGIAPGRLADEAAYWLALWYESRGTEQTQQAPAVHGQGLNGPGTRWQDG